MKKVIQIIVSIDYETDERAGSVGCDSIGGTGLFFEGEDSMIHDVDLGLCGQFMASMDSKDIVKAVRNAGYTVDDDVTIETDSF